MKVLLLSAYGHCRGGSQRSLLELFGALVARGVAVCVASPEGPFVAALPRSVRWLHLPSTHALDGRLQQLRPDNVHRLVRVLRAEKPDVVHTFQFGSHLLARLAGALAHRPVLHTLLGPLSPGERFGGGHVGAIAGGLLADAVARGADPHGAHVVPSWLDLAAFPRTPLPERARVVLLTRLDGPLARLALVFAETARRLAPSGVSFAIAGDGTALERVRDAPLERLGHVEDVQTVLGGARVVVGVGRALLEAMASGRAAVCLGRTGFGGMVGPERVGRLAFHNFSGRGFGPGAADALVAELRTLLEDPAGLQTRVDWGHGWVERYHDVRSAAAHFESLYSEAVARGPEPHGEALALVARLGGARLWRGLVRAAGPLSGAP